MDEKYDTAGGAIDTNDPWRKKEVSTHKPGSLGNLLGKMVYLYSGANLNTDTPSASYFYAYFYDAVGNLLWTVDNSGYLNYTFSQDAFGNELSVSPFSGTSWSTARTYCANEHQTGKWIDPFTGLYFFHARWYDSGVGRFVSQEIVSRITEPLYIFAHSNPIQYFDFNGLYGAADPPWWKVIIEFFFPSDPNEDQEIVECLLNHRQAICTAAGDSEICHLSDINVSEWVDEAVEGIGSCVADTACCMVVGAALEKTAGSLIHGRLKHSRSYFSDLADYTQPMLEAMCRAGDQRACKMVKLIKNSKPLMCKMKGKGNRKI